MGIDFRLSASMFTFNFTPLAGQEFIGRWTVQGQARTMTLTGCDTVAGKGGVKVRGAVEKCDTWVINIWVWGLLSGSLSYSGAYPFFESCHDEGFQLDRFLACRSR
jgi:hypothetical protein